MAQHPYLLFTINEIRPHPGFPQRYEHALWFPPRIEGASYVANGPSWGKWYYYDGSGILQIFPSQPGWAASAQAYRTSSVYTDGGMFWSAPYDVSTRAVGNGRNDDTEDDSGSVMSGQTEEEDSMFTYDWRPICFQNPGQRSQPSAVYYGMNDQRLHVRRSGQDWINKLFPHRNRPSGQATNNPVHGGLIGDISLLLALVAFSAAPENIETTLVHCLRVQVLPWNTPPGPVSDGWQEQRGLVVTVYELPGWREHLQALEAGTYGKIFN